VLVDRSLSGNLLSFNLTFFIRILPLADKFTSSGLSSLASKLGKSYSEEGLLVLALATRKLGVEPNKMLQRPCHNYTVFCRVYNIALPEKDAAERMRRLLVREGLRASDSNTRDDAVQLLSGSLKGNVLAMELAIRLLNRATTAHPINGPVQLMNALTSRTTQPAAACHQALLHALTFAALYPNFAHAAFRSEVLIQTVFKTGAGLQFGELSDQRKSTKDAEQMTLF